MEVAITHKRAGITLPLLIAWFISRIQKSPDITTIIISSLPCDKIRLKSGQ